MKNQYNLLVGLALLLAVAAAYLFPEKHYFSSRTGEEIKLTQYAGHREADPFKHLVREESRPNYEAGITAGIVALGLGFFGIGLLNRNKAV